MNWHMKGKHGFSFIYQVFQSDLKQIVDAGFDVNVVAAPMPVDPIRHLHRPGL